MEEYKKVDENTLEVTCTKKYNIDKKMLEEGKQRFQDVIKRAEEEIENINIKLDVLIRQEKNFTKHLVLSLQKLWLWLFWTRSI